MTPDALNASGQKPAVTIAVPALNEEVRLEKTVGEAVQAAEDLLPDYEIVIVNDGSDDGTADVADRLATSNAKVSVIHQPTNLGVGAAYSAVLARAKHPYIMVIPGDNAFEESGVRQVFSVAGKAEIVVSYRSNPTARMLVRRIMSKICTMMLRVATGCPLRDGHSLFLWPCSSARNVKVPTDYRYHLVTLSSLLPRAESYIEVPVILSPRPDSFSRVLRLRTVWRLGLMMTVMMFKNLTTSFPTKPVRIDETDE
jgi:glycosyltransferase involved in cell wall biosynthesis